SGDIIYNKDLEKNQMVVPKSGYHFPISADKRLEALLDEGSFQVMDADLSPVDALGFVDSRSYKDRIADYQKRTGLKDAVLSGMGQLGGLPVSVAVMDFRFIGASMGSVVGEKITRAIERGVEKKC